MKIQHKSTDRGPRSATVDDDYEHEVQRSTERGERLYAQAQHQYQKAQERLARAERKLDRARTGGGAKNRKRQIRELEAVVELRRIELEKYHRMMVAASAGAEHRGSKSYRPIAQGGVL